MTRRYVLVFDCCGNFDGTPSSVGDSPLCDEYANEVSLGFDRSVGKHDQFCLSCDTDNPETHVERREFP